MREDVCDVGAGLSLPLYGYAASFDSVITLSSRMLR